MDVRIEELAGAQTARAFAAMHELRTRLSSREEFCERVERQRAEGYRLVAVLANGEEDALAVAGFRLGHNLAWGRYLYVDDLVTRAACRRTGHGARLLAWLRAEAARLGCDQLHLDSGHHRHDAHRAYLRAGLDITSHHFSIDRL